jgi:hypothetical protein
VLIAARGVGLIAIVAFLVYAAAGFSGYLINDSFCDPVNEGSYAETVTRWTPPGLECFVQESSSTDASGQFLYDGKRRLRESTGSWPVFLVALFGGLGVVGLTLRRRRVIPAWLRLTAATTFAFALAGVGAYIGGWQFSMVMGMYLGVPVAAVADRLLRSGPRAEVPDRAGIVGAGVAFCALMVAAAGWLYGLGVGVYGLTLLLVAITVAASVSVISRAATG